MRAEYRREDLGKGTRGKYFAHYEKGTNLVLLNDEVARAFPTAAAVNEALSGLLALARQTYTPALERGHRASALLVNVSAP